MDEFAPSSRNHLSFLFMLKKIKNLAGIVLQIARIIVNQMLPVLEQDVVPPRSARQPRIHDESPAGHHLEKFADKQARHRWQAEKDFGLAIVLRQQFSRLAFEYP